MASRNCQYSIRRVTKSSEITCPWPRGPGHARGRRAAAVGQNPQNGLATKRFRAIDLSCVRACGAGAGAKTSNSELDFPVGAPSVLLPQPPIDAVIGSGHFLISGHENELHDSLDKLMRTSFRTYLKHAKC